MHNHHLPFGRGGHRLTNSTTPTIKERDVDSLLEVGKEMGELRARLNRLEIARPACRSGTNGTFAGTTFGSANFNFKLSQAGKLIVRSTYWDDGLLIFMNGVRYTYAESPGRNLTLDLTSNLVPGPNYLYICCWNHEGDASFDLFLDAQGQTYPWQSSVHNYWEGTMFFIGTFTINVTQ
jgi:hypothetical protein